MANEATKTYKAFGRSAIVVTLLSGATGTTTGAWAYVAGVHPLSVYVDCNNADVNLYSIMRQSTPTESVGHSISLLSNGRFFTLVSGAQQYLMAKVTSYTSGTVTAYAFGYGAE